MTASPTREAVAVFHSESDLQAAIDDLLSHGFDRAELSLLASSDTVDQKLGRHFTKVKPLEDDAEVPSVAYVASEDIGAAQGAVISGLLYVGALAGLIPVVASGGGLAAAIIGTAIGGGSGTAIGSILADLIGADHADYISDRLEHGGLVLWVRTWTQADETRAVSILKKHSGEDVHLHGVPETRGHLNDRYLGSLKHAKTHTYRGTDYVRAGEAEYYLSGRIYTSRKDIEAHIERQKYLQSLYTASKAEEFDLEAALRDPSSAFATPQSLAASALTQQVKLELLKRWAFDTKSFELAESEGMRDPAEKDPLQDITLLIQSLEAWL
jgi:hypothetical protein